MSFILDALRKSEHERQRAAMPGIAQVPFGLPRRELPRWAIAVIGVLGVALLALGGAWWHSTRNETAASAGRSATPRTEIPLEIPPPTAATPPAAVYSAPPAAARSPEPSTAGIERATPPAPTRGTQTEASTAFGSSAATPQNAPTADEPGAAAEPTLPSATALAAEGVALPPLRLELHAYSAKLTDRFVFINGTKYVEGQTLAEGPRVVSIAPNGVVLVYVGRRFLLTAQ